MQSAKIFYIFNLVQVLRVSTLSWLHPQIPEARRLSDDPLSKMPRSTGSPQ
jgi:hypothetical protein